MKRVFKSKETDKFQKTRFFNYRNRCTLVGDKVPVMLRWNKERDIFNATCSLAVIVMMAI